MAFGLLNIPYESIVVPYHDEKTPTELTGVKMLPIVTDDNGYCSNESLDIIKHFDSENALWNDEFDLNTINDKCNDYGKTLHNLAMPNWIFTKEFTPEAREYFQKKKEVKRGPFKNLYDQKDKLFLEMREKLSTFDENLNPFYESSKITIKDIMIASHLWGLYIVPEWQFEYETHEYLQRVKKLCKFDYHGDFWK